MWTLDAGNAELLDNIENIGFFLNHGRYDGEEWKSAKIQDRVINEIPGAVCSRKLTPAEESRLCAFIGQRES